MRLKCIYIPRTESQNKPDLDLIRHHDAEILFLCVVLNTVNRTDMNNIVGKLLLLLLLFFFFFFFFFFQKRHENTS